MKERSVKRGASPSLPSLADLERIKRRGRISVVEILRSEGIRTTADLVKFTSKHARPGESRFNVLHRLYGEDGAIKIMRLVEVAEWDL